MGILDKLLGKNKKNNVQELLNRGAIIIDVRNPGEFQSRRFEGSINIPLPEVKENIEELKAKGKPVIVCCASGVRSASAKSILVKAGIETENAGGWRALEKYDV